MTVKYHRKARLTVTTNHDVFVIEKTWDSEYHYQMRFEFPSINDTWYKVECDDGAALCVLTSEIIAVEETTLEYSKTGGEE